jgi:hypothetical protein
VPNSVCNMWVIDELAGTLGEQATQLSKLRPCQFYDGSAIPNTPVGAVLDMWERKCTKGRSFHMLNQWGSVKSPRGLSFLVVYAVLYAVAHEHERGFSPNPGVETVCLLFWICYSIRWEAHSAKAMIAARHQHCSREATGEEGRGTNMHQNIRTNMQVQGQIENSVSR